MNLITAHAASIEKRAAKSPGFHRRVDKTRERSLPRRAKRSGANGWAFGAMGIRRGPELPEGRQGARRAERIEGADEPPRDRGGTIAMGPSGAIPRRRPWRPSPPRRNRASLRRRKARPPCKDRAAASGISATTWRARGGRHSRRTSSNTSPLCTPSRRRSDAACWWSSVDPIRRKLSTPRRPDHRPDTTPPRPPRDGQAVGIGDASRVGQTKSWPWVGRHPWRGGSAGIFSVAILIRSDSVCQACRTHAREDCKVKT